MSYLHTLEEGSNFSFQNFIILKFGKKIYQEKEAEIGILFWGDVPESKLNKKKIPKESII